LANASERVVARAGRIREEAEQGQSNLFAGSAAEEGPPVDDFPEQPDWALDERLKGEKDTLGFYVTGHPLTRFAGEIERFAEASGPPELSRAVGADRRRAGQSQEAEDQEGPERGEDDAQGGPRGHERQRLRRHLREPLREGPGLGAGRPPGARDGDAARVGRG